MVYDRATSVLDDLEHIASGCYDPDMSDWVLEVCQSAMSVIIDLQEEIDTMKYNHAFENYIASSTQ